MSTKPPPPELAALGLHDFKHKTGNEFAGPCPDCGGEDRFVVWTEKQYPHWRYMCRVCNPDGGWIDQLFPKLQAEYQRMTPQERAQKAIDQAREQERRLQEQIERAQRVLKELQDARVWLQYHEQLTEWARNTWASWGIPEFYQDYWKLGFDPDRVIFTGGIEHHTPTMTIPVFTAETWACVNVRHRLLKPPKPGDKYRPERSGLPAALYVAEPDNAIAGRTLVVEGEKKAMVSFVTADDPNLQVIGIPGKNIKADLLTQLDKCDPVYICLDPDAGRESYQFAQMIGAERARLIELPDKIDDLILKHKLDKSWIRGVMRQAVRI